MPLPHDAVRILAAAVLEDSPDAFEKEKAAAAEAVLQSFLSSEDSRLKVALKPCPTVNGGVWFQLGLQSAVVWYGGENFRVAGYRPRMPGAQVAFIDLKDMLDFDPALGAWVTKRDGKSAQAVIAEELVKKLTM